MPKESEEAAEVGRGLQVAVGSQDGGQRLSQPAGGSSAIGSEEPFSTKHEHGVNAAHQVEGCFQQVVNNDVLPVSKPDPEPEEETKPSQQLKDDSGKGGDGTLGKACSECKRRKVRCDGQRPCSKCLRSGAVCQSRFIQTPERVVHGTWKQHPACLTCRSHRRKCDRQLPCSRCKELGHPLRCRYPPPSQAISRDQGEAARKLPRPMEKRPTGGSRTDTEGFRPVDEKRYRRNRTAEEGLHMPTASIAPKVQHPASTSSIQRPIVIVQMMPYIPTGAVPHDDRIMQYPSNVAPQIRSWNPYPNGLMGVNMTAGQSYIHPQVNAAQAGGSAFGHPGNMSTSLGHNVVIPKAVSTMARPTQAPRATTMNDSGGQPFDGIAFGVIRPHSQRFPNPSDSTDIPYDSVPRSKKPKKS